MQPSVSQRKMESIEELTAILAGTQGVQINIAALSAAGDDRLAWDPYDPAQLKEAQEKFYDYLSKGYVAYAVDPETGNAKNKKMIRFQPSAGEVIFKEFKQVLEAAKAGQRTVMRPAVVGG